MYISGSNPILYTKMLTKYNEKKYSSKLHVFMGAAILCLLRIYLAHILGVKFEF